MMMRYLFVMVAAGCGTTLATEKPDAAPAKDAPEAVDAPRTCTDHASPLTCGASCTACPTGVVGRELATCDGSACGLACVDEAPKCGDGSCSKITWAFEDGTLQGITPRAPAGLVLAVRPRNGNMALAIDVTHLTEVSFVIPICASGAGDFSTKTLTAQVTFDGTAVMGDQFYVQASAPAPTGGSFIAQQAFPNATQQFSAPMSNASTANATPTIVFQAGTYGAPFSGTVWFDDIRLE